MRGRFSLQDLLVSSDSEGQNAVAEESRQVSEDPITLGLVNQAIAKSLYERYVELLEISMDLTKL